jgi:hypothetical protein
MEQYAHRRSDVFTISSTIEILARAEGIFIGFSTGKEDYRSNFDPARNELLFLHCHNQAVYVEQMLVIRGDVGERCGSCSWARRNLRFRRCWKF